MHSVCILHWLGNLSFPCFVLLHILNFTCLSNSISGNTCKCICKEGLQESWSSSIPSISGFVSCLSSSHSRLYCIILYDRKIIYVLLVLRVHDVFVLQLGLVLGLILATIVGVGLHFGARLFTKDVHVLHLIIIGIPVFLALENSNTTI